MKLLVLDASTSICGVALVEGNESEIKLISSIHININNAHSERMMLFVEYVMQQSSISSKDIQAIAVTIGPGSFTGLRIGLSVAKGLAFSFKVPLVTVPTLEAIALPWIDHYRRIWVALTSRKKEYYITFFEDHNVMIEGQVWKFDDLENNLLQGDLLLTDDPISFGELSGIHISNSQDGLPNVFSVGKIGLTKAIAGVYADLDNVVPDYFQGFRGAS